MIKKIVEILSCSQCPHKEVYYPAFPDKGMLEIFKCAKTNLDLEIGAKDWWLEIPVWCPLPTDYKDRL